MGIFFVFCAVQIMGIVVGLGKIFHLTHGDLITGLIENKWKIINAISAVVIHFLTITLKFK